MSTPTELFADQPEPEHGSVLLLSSLSGTAVQRFYSDGAYHHATGGVDQAYAALFASKDGKARKVYLIHTPMEDPKPAKVYKRCTGDDNQAKCGVRTAHPSGLCRNHRPKGPA